ncbi:MAG: class 1 fructose-bisphosphatase [Alphaproteobacteria bacterium]|jgi:fructose-1,6-bisphosphatase I|nr:class 1 fructose-bisphosphatase [Alphaproteobacteria bacterium]
MRIGATLDEALSAEVAARPSPHMALLRRTLLGLAEAGGALSWRVAEPPLDGRLGAYAGGVNSDGDAQRKLDLIAETLFCDALRDAPVAAYLSEETEGATHLNETAPLAAAIDPLDGSSGIDVNAPIGALFSILPMTEAARGDPAQAFRQTGRAQLAAGIFVFSAQTSLMLSLGRGVQLYVYDRGARTFRLVEPCVRIPEDYPEFAINGSNQLNWPDPVRGYIEDCLSGVDGPRGRHYNMRWMGSLVAEAYRILQRGGIYLYPADTRPGFERGRLRLIYEANPVAFLCEQAGGAATDGLGPILDIVPETLHERVPLVFGSAEKVALVGRYHQDMARPSPDSPLFGRRGLMRR